MFSLLLFFFKDSLHVIYLYYIIDIIINTIHGICMNINEPLLPRNTFTFSCPKAKINS